MFEGLTRWVLKGGVLTTQPDIAETWESKDAQTWIFHLREGVTFQAPVSRPVTAQDFVDSWTRVTDPDNESYVAYILAPLEGCDDRGYQTDPARGLTGVRAIDDQTLQVTLRYPFADFPATLGHPVAAVTPVDYIDRVGAKAFARKPVGTGPYAVRSWRHDKEIVLAKNPAYWDKERAGYLDGVEFLVVKDQPRTMALRAGNLDYIFGVTDEYFSTVYRGQKLYEPFESGNMKLYPRFSDTANCIYLNNHAKKGHSPFEDERVRKALDLSIDRRELARALYGQRGIPTVQGYDPSISQWGFDDIKVPEPDISRAKQLLKEAGYPDGLDVDFYITPTWGKNDQMAQVVQQMAKEAGFRIKIVTQIGLQYWGHLFKMDVPMYVFQIGGDDPMSMYYGFFHTDSGKYWSGYAPLTGVKDPELDKMLDDMAMEIDIKKKREKFKKVVLRINEKSYALTYMLYILANGWTKKLQNFHPEKYYIPEQAIREAWLAS